MPNINEVISQIAKEAMDSAQPSGVYFGTVLSTSPLQISVEQKMTLTEQQLILGTLVRTFSVTMTFNHTTNNATHTHEIHDSYTGGGSAEDNTHAHGYSGTKTFQVNLGLNAGEKVILLRVQGGQKYLVLDRVR